MDLGLTGRVAIVTGGSRGIGRAIAKVLASEGVDVAICARQRCLADLLATEGARVGAKLSVRRRRE